VTPEPPSSVVVGDPPEVTVETTTEVAGAVVLVKGVFVGVDGGRVTGVVGPVVVGLVV